MWEKVLPLIGGVFAVVGLILIFCDVITAIKRRNKTKTNIAGLVLLSVGIVGYIITDLILPAAMPDGSGWPPFASLLWIALFWAYVVLDAIVTLGDIKVAKRKKKERRAARQASEPDPQDDDAVAEAKRLWAEHAHDSLQLDESDTDNNEPRP